MSKKTLFKSTDLLPLDAWGVIALHHPTIYYALAQCDRALGLRFARADMTKKAKQLFVRKVVQLSSTYYILPNGKKHGPEERWNNGGVRFYLAHWQDGKKHGTTERWNKIGVRIYLAHYQNGLLHGVPSF